MASDSEPARQRPRRAKNKTDRLIVKDLAMAFKETAKKRLFLMKDLATAEEAVGLGLKVHEGKISFYDYAELNFFSVWMASEILC